MMNQSNQSITQRPSLPRKIVFFGLVLPLFMLLLGGAGGLAKAEIPADVRDVFESMLDNLEPDLQGPFPQGS